MQGWNYRFRIKTMIFANPFSIEKTEPGMEEGVVTAMQEHIVVF